METRLIFGPQERKTNMNALVLEGGGMRGLFTAGALDALMDHRIYIDRCYGVSAGACNMISYYSGQRGRSRRVNVDYAGDKRYMSWDNFFKTGSLFSEEMMYHTIPETLLPFDYDAYQKANPEAYAVATSMLSGRPVYLRVPADLRKDYKPILASMSLPLISTPVKINGDLLLDGGLADPIPAEKALKDGCGKLLIVLTRQKGYVKSPESTLALSKIWYHDYPSLLRTMERRHTIYNAETAFVEKLEAEGKAIVIRPPHPVDVGRTEKDPRKLDALYAEGYNETCAAIGRIRELLGIPEETASEEGQ